MAGFNLCPCMMLKTGSYIVAFLEVINYAASIVLGILRLAITAKHKKDIVQGDQTIQPSQEVDDEYEYHMLLLTSTFIIVLLSLVTNLFGLVFYILLTVGVYNGSRKTMLAWMVMECVNLVMKVVVALYPLRNSPSSESQIVKIGLSIYFLLVVYAHYVELRAAEPPNYFRSAGQMEMRHTQIQTPNQNQIQAQEQGQTQALVHVHGYDFEQDQFLLRESEFLNISEPTPNYYHYQSFQEKPNPNLPTYL